MAGGAGQRLKPLTCDLPKPMVPILGRPVMEYCIELACKHGIKEIATTLQYLPEKIIDHFGEGERFNVDLRHFIEKEPLGTAGSVKNAAGFFTETFIVLSGDALCDIDLTAAYEFHKSKGSLATLIIKSMDVPLEYGVVITKQDGSITRFLEKPGWGEVFSDTVNTGIYILEPQIFDYIEQGKSYRFLKRRFSAAFGVGPALCLDT